MKAEYFKNRDLNGEPFFSRTDPIDNPNWIYGTRVPELRRQPDFSIRWSGFITAPATGNFNFTIKGDDGYSMYINNKILIEDWTVHDEATTKSNNIFLEEGETYSIRIEYFRTTGAGFSWPVLSVQWELMDVDNFKEAVDLAKSSDAVIFIGGITPQLEGEEMDVRYEGFRGGDRISLDLPKVQENLLKLIQSAGKPVVLVLTGGSAISVNWAEENTAAIVNVWYPGQEGGTALANILFGDYNPAGRLPVTYYKSVDQLPPFEDYSMKGRTYRYFRGEPLYPFGYGLSYSEFKYDNLRITGELKTDSDIKVSVDVQNAGKKAGDEVVQLYIKDIEASVPVPVYSLQGFRRIHLLPGEKKTVEFILKPRQLAVINDDARFVVEPGRFEISAGGLLPDTKAPTTEYVSGKIELTGKPYFAD